MKYREEMKKGFITEFLKQGGMEGAPQAPAPPKPIQRTQSNPIADFKNLGRQATSATPWFGPGSRNLFEGNEDYGKRMANTYLNGGLKQFGVEPPGASSLLPGQHSIPKDLPFDGLNKWQADMAKYRQDKANFKPQYDASGKQINQAPVRPAPMSLDMVDAYAKKNTYYQNVREGLLQDPEKLKGVNSVVTPHIQNKTYGAMSGSIGQDGNIQKELTPGNIDWGRLWGDHKGKIMAGAGILALPLLAKLLFSNNQQQQAPQIVINNSGQVAPNMQRAFAKYQ